MISSINQERSMAEESSGYKHDASDRKLDQSVEVAGDGGQTSDTQHSSASGRHAAGTEKDSATDTSDATATRDQHDDAEKGS
jgi:hypothetical protein